MSKQYFEIKFVTLGQLSTEIYSNKFVVISAHKIRGLCLNFALIPSLLL